MKVSIFKSYFHHSLVDNSAYPLWGISSGLEPLLGWGWGLRTLKSTQKRKAVIPIQLGEEGLGPVCTPVVVLLSFTESCVSLDDAYNVALGNPSECCTLRSPGVMRLGCAQRSFCLQNLCPFPSGKPLTQGSSGEQLCSYCED